MIGIRIRSAVIPPGGIAEGSVAYQGDTSLGWITVFMGGKGGSVEIGVVGQNAAGCVDCQGGIFQWSIAVIHRDGRVDVPGRYFKVSEHGWYITLSMVVTAPA